MKPCFSGSTSKPKEDKDNHTGSVVARNHKDRIAALGTRSYNEKFVTESQRGQMKMKFTVGIWNVRSLWQAGTYAMLKKELERFRYDVVGLCEVRWTGSGELEKGKLLWSGTETEHIYRKNVKIIVGDWNAKIGSDNIEFEEVMGKYGVGDRNDRGKKLLKLSLSKVDKQLEKLSRKVDHFSNVLSSVADLEISGGGIIDIIRKEYKIFDKVKPMHKLQFNVRPTKSEKKKTIVNRGV
ncbi:hypothetical protein HELRODRAFT_158528 [Helobdella robusta]|uniref:Endonuclease/exonuclease/phosphatase domain-containing protein n=1 Tax=Helobdella robusta TaxID=6412 RepID=T1EMX1_HELRO|nr:hypothetical protein HELRODRAFT_158528 [Helobdella robusta]ESO12104.1 hypothetical protein HELRODRAFT_158528 [Helobdella robusta]